MASRDKAAKQLLDYKNKNSTVSKSTIRINYFNISALLFIS